MSFPPVGVEEAASRLVTERDKVLRLIGLLDDSDNRSVARILFSTESILSSRHIFSVSTFLHSRPLRNGEVFSLPLDQLRQDNVQYRRQVLEQLRHDFHKFHEHNGAEHLIRLFMRLDSLRAVVGGLFSEVNSVYLRHDACH